MKSWTRRGFPRATAMMLAAVLGLAGLPNQASAFQFNNGDLVLAIFGNNQEFYYDVGTAASLLAPGAKNSFDVAGLAGSPFAPASGVVAGPQTQWELLGAFTDSTASPAATGVFTFAGSQNNAAGILTKPGVGSSNTLQATWNSALLASTGATPAGPGSTQFLASTDPASYTTTFGLGGFLGGTWPTGLMQGSLDSTLSMIKGQARQGSTLNVISDIGRAVLSASGTLSICGGAGCSVAAVPIPAAAVLFVSGLVGVIGIARRSGAKMLKQM